MQRDTLMGRGYAALRLFFHKKTEDQYGNGNPDEKNGIIEI
jgi:hypothetical protein